MNIQQNILEDIMSYTINNITLYETNEFIINYMDFSVILNTRTVITKFINLDFHNRHGLGRNTFEIPVKELIKFWQSE